MVPRREEKPQRPCPGCPSTHGPVPYSPRRRDAGARRSSVGISRRVGRARRVRADRVGGRAAVRQPRIRRPRLRRPGPRDRGTRAGPRSSHRGCTRNRDHRGAFRACGRASLPALRRGFAAGDARVHGRERGAARRHRRSIRRLRRRAVAVRRRAALARRAVRRNRGRLAAARHLRAAAAAAARGRRPARTGRARAGRGGAAGARGRGRRLPLRRRRDRAAGGRLVPGHAPRLGGGRGARRRPPGAEPVLVHRGVFRARRQGGRGRGGRRRHARQGARPRAPQLRAVGPDPTRATRR